MRPWRPRGRRRGKHNGRYRKGGAERWRPAADGKKHSTTTGGGRHSSGCCLLASWGSGR